MKWHADPLYRGLAVVALAALALRLTFVLAVGATHGDAASIVGLHGDAPDYRQLAVALADGRGYGAGDVQANVVGLVRVPGYPILYAACLALGGGGHGGMMLLLAAQATADALVGTLGGLLAWTLWRSRPAAWAVAAALALDITGIGLAATPITDGPFALLLTGAFLLLLRAPRTPRAAPALACGLAFAAATLVKPTPLLFPIALPLAWALVAKFGRVPRRRALRNLLLCGAAFVLPVLGWAVRNAVVLDVFAVSIVTERNVRFMLIPEAEIRGWQTRPDLVKDLTVQRYYELGHEDLWWLTLPDMTAAEYVRRQREHIRGVIDEFPLLMVRGYVKGLGRNLRGRWDIFDRQLPPGQAPPAARAAFRPLEQLGRWRDLRMALFIAGVAVVPAFWIVARRRAGRRRAALATAVLLAVVYLVLTAATTHSQGSRILYPAHPLVLALAAGWLPLARRLRTKPSSSG